MSRNKEYEKYWNFPGSKWRSESAWWGWLRSCLRKSWNRHPIKTKYIQDNRIKIPNPNPASAKRFPEIWGAQCQCCLGTYPLSAGKKEGAQKITMQIDHKQATQGLKAVKDIQGFVERLFLVTADDLRFLCSVCNKDFAYVDKYGVSLEEAKATRKAIEIQKTKGGDVKWLENCGIIPASNSVRRRAQIVQKLLEGESNGN